MENSDNIKVISKEGTEFLITKKSADLSILLKNAREEMGSDESIPLVEVDEKSLQKIIQYLNKWNGEQPSEIEKPLKSSILKEVTDEWSAEFIDNLDLEELTNITVSANYMEITPLLDLACAKLASMCKDKSEDEIFKSFGIVDTFSEEERQKLKEENKWIEENLN
jgi:S-phase kinase-associated protein 1